MKVKDFIPHEIIQALILFLFLIFSQFNFIYNENIEVFFTVAHYINVCQENLFQCINENHELKPFFSKLFYFWIYKLTNIFINWDNKYFFVFTNQIIYSTFSIICFYLFSRDSNFDNKNKKIIFLFLIVVFYVAGPGVFMENEHAVVPISLLAIYFFRQEKLFGILASSILLSFVTGMKGITLSYTLMTIVFCISFYKFNKKKIIYFFFFLLLFHSIFIYIVFEDLIYAKSIQSIKFNFEYIYRIFLKLMPIDGYFQYILVFVPPIFGCFISCIIIILTKKEACLNNKKFLFLLTSFAIAGVILQRGYHYHYYIYIYYFLLFSLFFLKNNDLKLNYLFVSAVTIVIYLVFYTPIIFNKFFFEKYNFGKLLKDSHLSERKIFNEINIILKNEKEILYLADGTPNFYLKPMSFCKEFNSLPLARFGKDIPESRWDPYIKKDPNNKLFLKNQKCTENYRGQYIVWQKNYVDITLLNNVIVNYNIIKEYNTKYETFFLLKKI